jgi:hypothetical protein
MLVALPAAIPVLRFLHQIKLLFRNQGTDRVFGSSGSPAWPRTPASVLTLEESLLAAS